MLEECVKVFCYCCFFYCLLFYWGKTLGYLGSLRSIHLLYNSSRLFSASLAEKPLYWLNQVTKILVVPTRILRICSLKNQNVRKADRKSCNCGYDSHPGQSWGNFGKMCWSRPPEVASDWRSKQAKNKQFRQEANPRKFKDGTRSANVVNAVNTRGDEQVQDVKAIENARMEYGVNTIKACMGAIVSNLNVSKCPWATVQLAISIIYVLIDTSTPEL